MAALEIPTLMGFNSKVFDIGHYQQLSPAGTAGFIQTINRTSPLWYAEYTTPEMTGDGYNETRAFLDLLEGSMNTFLAYDPRRPMPWAYRSYSLASNPWGAGATITGADYANSTIQITGLPNGAIVSKGDYMAFQVGLIWYLFRTTTGHTSAGAPITIGVKPRPAFAGAYAGTALRYKKACMEMKLIPNSLREQDSVDGLGGAFSFKAAQFTRRAEI